MSDIIRLLPDSVANQIAAGEVVQRPASVVKELVENAIDAGASRIQVILKNVGKTSIQVIDDGKGMSPTDARMAFERHATSKIASAGDLFNITTLGFRGEALPSIASVAEIELRTRRAEDELGTYINIAASECKSQEPVNIPLGTNITVKNLFFNIPARRKFLKSDTTELRNCTTEFLRIVLANPQVAFTLINNGEELYELPATGLRQRIANVYGKNINAQLINVECDTQLVRVVGFVGHPKHHARNKYDEQYFFVNGRFMKHPFFYKAILEAYSGLITPDQSPSYFLYFSVDQAIIDVNIHPTKTEIKFQCEADIYQILVAAIREPLGKFNIAPSLDFDMDGSVDFAPPVRGNDYRPSISYNPSYNPFKSREGRISAEDSDFEKSTASPILPSEDKAPISWAPDFPEDVEDEKEEQEEGVIPFDNAEETAFTPVCMQMRGRYIVTPVRAGLMFIDQKRAHERILFEQYTKVLCSQPVAGQKSMFPETLELSSSEFQLLSEINADLEYLGYEITEFGKNTFAIYAVPSDMTVSRAKEIILELLTYYRETEGGDIRTKMHERVALSLAKAAAMKYNTPLSQDEMSDIVDSLFACENHNFTADGKTIVYTMGADELSGKFK